MDFPLFVIGIIVVLQTQILVGTASFPFEVRNIQSNVSFPEDEESRIALAEVASVVKKASVVSTNGLRQAIGIVKLPARNIVSKVWYKASKHDYMWKHLLFDARLPSLENPYPIPAGAIVRLVLHPNAFGNTDLKVVAAGLKPRPLPHGLASLTRDAQAMLRWAMERLAQFSLDAILKAFKELKDSSQRVTISSLKDKLEKIREKYALKVVANIASLELQKIASHKKKMIFREWFIENLEETMKKARTPCQNLHNNTICEFDTKIATINIQVTPVADRPVMDKNDIIFPPVPSFLDEIFKVGVRTKTIVKAVPFVINYILKKQDPKKINALRELISKDADPAALVELLDDSMHTLTHYKQSYAFDGDGDQLGLAINCSSPGMNAADIGKWQIKTPADNDFKDLSSLIPQRQPVDCSCFIILNSLDVLRFEPKRATWDSFNTRLRVYARKQRDGRNTGSVCINLQTLSGNGDKNISSVPSLMVVSRLGCSGKLDNSTVDQCGICDGDNDCVGCDGVKNSTARTVCGVCYGGNTNRTNPMQLNNNCLKYCNSSFKDECEMVCKYRYHIYNDCTGTCMGKARPNDCGVCVGKTGLPSSSSMDSCGVCKGDNSTCTDCAGTVGGTHTVDDCGNCLDSKSVEFNKCTKISHVDPGTIKANTAYTLRVVVNAQSFTGVTCVLRHVKTGHEVSAKTDGFIPGDQNLFKFNLSVPAIARPVGNYKLKCTIQPGAKVVTYENVTVLGDDVRVTAVVPSTAPRGRTFTVAVQGTGFMDTSLLRCYLKSHKKFKRHNPRKVQFLTSSKIECSFPAISDPDVNKVCLRFSRNVDLCTDFHFKEDAPVPRNCTISSKLKLCVLFDREVKPVRDCSQLFTKATTDSIFFKNTTCQWLDNKHRLCLGNLRTAVVSGVNVGVKYTSIKSALFSSDTTYNTALGQVINLKCPAPKKVSPIKIGILGRRMQDPGFRFRLRAKISAPGKCSITWSAALPSGAANPPKIQADLDKLNKWLKKKRHFLNIPRSLIQPNATYQLTLSVTSKVLAKTATRMINVTRKGVASVLPRFIINVRKKKRTVILSVSIKIPHRLTYKWFCDQKHVTIKGRGRIGIVKNPPVGRFKCHVRVSTKVNSIESFREESVSFNRTSLPIKCNIKDGDRAVGENDKVKLRSTVEDPDNDKGTMTYTWTCQDASKSRCVNKNGSFTVLPEKKDIEVDVSSIKKQVNKTLTFRLTAMKGNRITVSSVNVTVTQGEPPLCKIKTPKDPVDTRKPVRIIGLIQSRSETTEYSFTVVTDDESEDAYFDLYAEGATRTDPDGIVEGKKRRNPALIINPNMLAQNASFKFRLTCRDENGVESYAESELRTLTSLTPGEVFVEPTEGEELNTTFTIGADGSWEPEKDEEEGEAEAEAEGEGEGEREGEGGEAPVSRKRRSTEEEDTDGSDEIPSSLTYRCGRFVGGEKRKKVYLSAASSSDFCEVQLPAGRAAKNHSIEVFLEACTIDEPVSCALANMSVTVKPRQITAQDVELAKQKVDEAFKSGGISDLQAIVSSTLESMKEEFLDDEMDDSMLDERRNITREEQEGKQAAKEFVKKVFDGANEYVEGGQVSDEIVEDMKDIYVNAAQSTDKDTVDTSFISRTLDNFRQLAKPREQESSADESAGDDSSRRRRRAVSGPTPVIQEKTPEEVEKTLAMYHNLTKPHDYSKEHMSSKKQFIEMLADEGRSMCNGIVNGDAARVAQSPSTVLRSVKNAFQNVHTNYSKTGCETCSKFTRKSAEVLLGQTLKDDYDDWNCDADGCNGACIVSYQTIYDYFLNSSYKGVTRASDVVNVLLFNPSTYASIKVSGLASPVKYKIFVSDGVDMAKADLKCHRWGASLNNWTTSGVTTVSKNNADKSIICSADHLGTFTVFDLKGGIETITVATTPPPTTAGPPATTAAGSGESTSSQGSQDQATTGSMHGSKESTTAQVLGTDAGTTSSSGSNTGAPGEQTTMFSGGGSQNTAQSTHSGSGESKPTTTGGDSNQPTTQPREIAKVVSFALDADYDYFIKSDNKEQFQASFTVQIAKNLGVKESRITNLFVTKGSIVVTFTLIPADNDASVKNLTALLQTMVENGNITLKTPQGQELKVIKTSFMKQDPPTTPVQFATKGPVEGKGGLKRMELIGIIVGVSIIVIFLVAAVLYCHCKSKQRVKDCDEDDDDCRKNSVEGFKNPAVEEERYQELELHGIKSSLPGSPIYDNIR